MSELRPYLDREAGRVRTDPGALDAVTRRAERRRAIRRVTSGVVALAVAGGSIGLAYAAFRTDGEGRPAGQPVPAPTPTGGQATPEPLPIEILSGTENDTPAAYVAARLAGEGHAIREGGYDVVLTGTATHQPPHTVILCPPMFDHEASLLQQALFPTARIDGALPDEDVALRIILGRDLEEQDDGGLEAFDVAEAFMGFRALRDDRAHRFLSDLAADQYHRGEGGLELFGYAEGGYELTALSPAESGAFAVVARIFERGSDRVRIETLAVGDQDPEDGTPEILSAELNEEPPS
jgi:hypothetical protein